MSQDCIKRTNILHIVRLAEGGMQRHVLSLIRNSDHSRFSHALTAAPELIKASGTDNIGFLPVEIGDDLKPSTFAVGLKVAAFARKNGTDVIHAHGYKAAVVGALAAAVSFKPFVFTAHNLFPKSAGRASRLALNFCSARATKVIAVSTAAAGGLAEAGVNPKKLVVIPNGIDPKEYDRPADPAALRSRLGVKNGEKLVVCVARLTRVKGVNYLIEAAPAVLKAFPDARVWIVGSGPDERALGMLSGAADPKGRIKLLGFRDDVRDILSCADVVVVPSIEEGQSILTLEAMALSRPVVASRVGGLTDSITDGITGLLVPPADPPSISGAVVKLLGEPDLAVRLGENARARVEADFTVEKMIRKTEELYSCVAC